jgi:sulfonate transport system permease protein
VGSTFVRLFGWRVGFRLGLVLPRLDFLARALDPFVVAANGIPRVALARLFIIWFGIGELSKIVLAGTLTFFLTFLRQLLGPAGGGASRPRRRAGHGRQRAPDLPQGLAAGRLPVDRRRTEGRRPVLADRRHHRRVQGPLARAGLHDPAQRESATGAVGGIVVLMLCVMLFNDALNRPERYVLRWRPRERSAAARELQ